MGNIRFDNEDLELLKDILEIIKRHNGNFSDNEIEILRGIYNIVNSLEEPERWITVKGNHIPVFEGQTPSQAIERFFGNKQPQNIAGIKRGKPMSFKEANEGKVNPNFHKGGGYHRNCQACIAVFEARLRGYNIETRPRGDDWEELRNYPNLAFIENKTKRPPRIVSTETNTPTDCYRWLNKNIKNGERYAFGFQPKDSLTGHIITVGKHKNGDLFFYDPQEGKTLYPKLLFNMKMHTVPINGRMIKLPLLFRIDNTELNKEWLNKISRPAK